MDALHELSFQPVDERENLAFETVLHGFVALEADKPSGESSSVFAQYDPPSRRWVLAFDTDAALRAFEEHWRDRIPRA
jgi:hypothetical protein